MDMMSIVCPKCHKRLLFGAETAGKLGRCSGCGGRVRIGPGAGLEAPPPERPAPRAAPVRAAPERPKPDRPAPPPELAEPIACANCGQSNVPWANFCRSCGKPMKPPAPAPAVVAVPVQAVRTVPQRPRALPDKKQCAGFWMRCAAAAVDAIILTGGVTVILFATGIPWRFFIGLWHFPSGPMFVSSLLSIALGWLYFGLFESSTMRATPGKLALNVGVVDLYGRRISFPQASTRYFAKGLSLLTLGAGFAMAGFTQHKQALHDRMAGCLVIRRGVVR